MYVRVKPTEQTESTTEPTEHEEPSFNVESDNTLVHRICGQQGKRFLMDKIFEEKSTQQELFETIGKTQVDNALSGYNNSIFAYGQTGTGKTYTMLGPNGGHGDLNDTSASQYLGLIPRILHYLFDSINKARQAREDSNTNVNTVNKVTISYMEIYQENVRDLLDPNVDHPTNLSVKEHKRDGPFVKNLIETVVTTPKEALALMELGNSSRTQAKTRMNDTSSRSHAVFTIRIDGHMKSTAADGRKRKFTSKMNLVDLAGSERQRNTGATGKRLREGSAINKSLSVLGTVIMNLVDIGDGKSRHVSARSVLWANVARCIFFSELFFLLLFVDDDVFSGELVLFFPVTGALPGFEIDVFVEGFLGWVHVYVHRGHHHPERRTRAGNAVDVAFCATGEKREKRGHQKRND